MNPHIRPNMFSKHIHSIKGEDNSPECIDSFVRSGGGMGGLPFEYECSSLHRQDSLVGIPTVARMGDEDDIRPIEISSLKKGNLSSAKRTPLLVRRPDHDDTAWCFR